MVYNSLYETHLHVQGIIVVVSILLHIIPCRPACLIEGVKLDIMSLALLRLKFVVLVPAYGVLLYKDIVFVTDFQKRTLLPWT